jgi:predicted O-methyltransferase YrrM
LHSLPGKENLKYLEIGSWEGESLSWVMSEILSHPSCRATVVDPFLVPATQTRFYENLKIQNLESRVQVLEQKSHITLPTLGKQSFDLIYVDGDHTYQGVYADALQAWPLLKPNGWMIFDDYYWRTWSHSVLSRPQKALDHFVNSARSNLQVLFKGHQLIVQKISELPDGLSSQIPSPTSLNFLPRSLAEKLDTISYALYTNRAEKRFFQKLEKS